MKLSQRKRPLRLLSTTLFQNAGIAWEDSMPEIFSRIWKNYRDNLIAKKYAEAKELFHNLLVDVSILYSESEPYT
jgi:hypothetical protein